MLFWDKGWDLPSAVGGDPCGLLQEAIDALEPLPDGAVREALAYMRGHEGVWAATGAEILEAFAGQESFAGQEAAAHG